MSDAPSFSTPSAFPFLKHVSSAVEYRRMPTFLLPLALVLVAACGLSAARAQPMPDSATASAYPYLPAYTKAGGAPTPVIFESDFGPDSDDAGALAVLHALADRREVEILAMGANSSRKWAAPAMDAVNTYYGRPDVPLGVWKGSEIMDYSEYNKHLAENFPNDLGAKENAPAAAALYQRVLQEQPDSSVVVVSVGALNNLYRLLRANRDLVAQKVKELVVMGGRFPPESGLAEAEHNFAQGRQRGSLPPATATVIEEWPTPIMFSGHEIGAVIYTGACLSEETPEANPVRVAYERYHERPGGDNQSYDLTAVLYAARGLANYWTAENGGSVHVLPDGRNAWQARPNKAHARLIERMAPEQVASVLEGLMCHPPSRSENAE